MPRQQAVAEEDPPDSGGRGPQRLHDADVAGLLDDDHREDRQDAEPRHGDDEEQQDVEDALLDGDRRQERALLLLPGRDAEETSGCSSSRAVCDLLGQRVEVHARLDLDLDLVDRPVPVAVVEQPASVCSRSSGT